VSGVSRLAALSNARRFVSAFASRFGSTILSFLLLLVASRLLPIDDYGLYVFLFSVGSALGLIAALGQQILVLKHYRREAPREDAGNRALVAVNMRWLALGCGTLLLASLAFGVFGRGLAHPYDGLWIAFAFAGVFAASEYLQSYFRVHGRINLSLLPREIVWRAASSLGLLAAAVAGLLAGGVGAMAIVTLLLAAATAYQAVVFLRDEGLGWTRGGGSAPAEWRAETGWFIANNVLNAAQSYLETILIGVLLGLDKAAFYFVAVRISQLLTLPVAAIDTVGVPMIAERFQHDDRAGAQRIVGRLSLGAFAISGLGAVCLALIAPFVLHLFNPAFVEHVDVLVVLCALAVGHAFFGPGSWLLMIGGGERFFLIARAALFIAYLALLAGLGQAFGLIGIAAAGLAFSVASNCVAARWIAGVWGVDVMATSFFLSRRALKPAAHSGMPRWQDLLFIRLSRSANDATDYFQIPTGRVVEVGTQVSI